MASHMGGAGNPCVGFGPFVLWPEVPLLHRGSVPVRLAAQTLRILAALIERAGEIVSPSELTMQVWPHAIDDGDHRPLHLQHHLTALRRALGDEPGQARYIAAVKGRGYQFVAPVQARECLGLPAPAAAPASALHNLPLLTKRFFGRADAVAAIHHELSVSRLVSIVGLDGIGKTSVALAVAERTLGAFADGVWHVDLSVLKDETLVPHTIATAIGLAANWPDLLGALCEHLRQCDMLLVLDGCEHVGATAASCAARMLANTPHIKLLVTGREPLRVAGERVHRLPGLGTPTVTTDLQADEALLFPGIQLFVDRAIDAEAFELSDAAAPEVAALCGMLDGLAPAIELAAARADLFSPDELWHQFAVFLGPLRDRALTRTLDWSYSLLPTSQARLLRFVSVFADMFDVEAAAAVSGLSVSDTAAALTTLQAKALLVVEVDGEDLLYRLLKSTRVLCNGKLDASGEAPWAHQCHAAHLAAVLERATAERAQRPSADWGATCARVLNDLRDALTCLGQDAAHRALRIRLSMAGLPVWTHLSHTEEGQVHVSAAIEALAAAGPTGSSSEVPLLAWLAGTLMVTRGLMPPALEALRRALAMAEHRGDTEGHRRCVGMIGRFELLTGEHQAGWQTLEAFATLAAEDPSSHAEGETQLALAELFLGRLPNARQRLARLRARVPQDALDAPRVQHPSDHVIDAAGIRSQVLWLTGSPDAAMRAAAHAIEQATGAGTHLSLNNALVHACPVFFWSGHHAQCERYVDMLDAHITRHGLLARRPVAMFYRAALACAQVDMPVDAAMVALGQAIAEFHAIQHFAWMPHHLAVLAEHLAKRGQICDAVTTIQAALERANASRERWCLPEVLRIQAAVQVAAGQLDEAEAVLGKAIAVAKEMGALSWQLRITNDLVPLMRGPSRKRQAHTLLSAVCSEFSEGFGTRDLVTAACHLTSLQDPRSR